MVRKRVEIEIRSRYRGWRGATLPGLLLLLLLAGCVTPTPPYTKSGQAERHYVQRGFGREYSGDSTKEYWVGVGDALQIYSPGLEELTYQTQVGPDGRIPVPVPGVGRLKVAGLTASEIEDRLVTVLSRYFRNASLVVSVPARNSKRIFLTGEVRKGGALRFEGDQTILDVMSRTAPSPFADTKRIIVWRADPLEPQGILVNLDEISNKGLTRTNILLKEDDIIFVPRTFWGDFASVLNDITAPLRAVTGTVGSLLRAGLVPYQVIGFDELATRAEQGRGGIGGTGTGGGRGNNFF
jgi:protein involved in polysaccharide export with SLBB domain